MNGLVILKVLVLKQFYIPFISFYHIILFILYIYKNESPNNSYYYYWHQNHV